MLVAGGVIAHRALLAPGPPNVLFILIDTLRGDRLGAYGREHRIAPFLTDLGDRSLVFERAYSASSWTVPAIISMFLGQRPFVHGVNDFLSPMRADQVTLAQVLSSHGYDTAGFLASSLMANDYGLYHRGFNEYRLVGNQYPRPDELADATEVNAAALRWLDRRTSFGPFFLYLHYMEPHWPYLVHEGITEEGSKTETSDAVIGFRAVAGNTTKEPLDRARFWGFSDAERTRLRDLYDGEVRYLDGRLAELFAELEHLGALDNTIVVVTADHGEELGEHGIFGHGAALYDSEIHVPLIVHVPGRAPGRVARPVETAGIAAALLRAVGVEPPASFQVPAMALEADAGASVAGASSPVSQLAKIADFTLWLHRTAVIEGDRKLLVAGDGTLGVYDLGTDAGEQTLLSPTAEETARATTLDTFDQRSVAAGAAPPMDAATHERLRGLGYVGAP